MAAVIDASAVVPLVIDEPVSGRSAAAIAAAEDEGHALHAPELLLVEVANALWQRVRREELAEGAARDLFGELSSSGIMLTPDRELVAQALRISIATQCTVYDGCYLALSRELDAVLVSADAQLVDAARSVGVEATLLTA